MQNELIYLALLLLTVTNLAPYIARLIKKYNQKKLLSDDSKISESRGLKLFQDDKDELIRILIRKLNEKDILSENNSSRRDLIGEANSNYTKRLYSLMHDKEEALEYKAKMLLSSVLHRVANSKPSSDILTSEVDIDSKETKSKIIGKEGRNIKTFENCTMVDLIVDDRNDRVTLSSFDPVRRFIAKNTLTELIKDGRVTPSKIEEMYTKCKSEADQYFISKGREALLETQMVDLPPSIAPFLGMLSVRYSYGQNVLDHSIEMSHIARMLATELGADPFISSAGALLHDIGKSATHEVKGSHVEIGIKILKKLEVDERIIDAMKSHHEEYPFSSVESVIVQVADHLSASRPGARSMQLDEYLNRLTSLEELTSGFPQVEKVMALEAGREIRVFVRADKTKDEELPALASEIARKIEQEIGFPGEIKIHLIKESHAIEWAR